MIRQAESMALSRQWTKRFLNVRDQSVLACGQNDYPISSAVLKFSTMWIVAEEETIVWQEIRITFSLREFFLFSVFQIEFPLASVLDFECIQLGNLDVD